MDRGTRSQCQNNAISSVRETSLSSSPLQTPRPPQNVTQSQAEGVRGKPLSIKEQQWLVKICADHVNWTNLASYKRSHWTEISIVFHEKSNRAYNWLSCRRTITRLVAQREAYWHAIENNLEYEDKMNRIIADEIDQWMGIDLSRDCQLKTPQEMLEARQTQNNMDGSDAIYHLELPVSQRNLKRIWKWLFLLPKDDDRSLEIGANDTELGRAGDKFEPSMSTDISCRTDGHIPLESLKSHEGCLSSGHSRCSGRSSGSDRTISNIPEDIYHRKPNNASPVTKKRPREDDEEDSIIAPPPKRIFRPTAVKDRPDLGDASPTPQAASGEILVQRDVDVYRSSALQIPMTLLEQFEAAQNSDKQTMKAMLSTFMGAVAQSVHEFSPSIQKNQLDPDPVVAKSSAILQDFLADTLAVIRRTVSRMDDAGL